MPEMTPLSAAPPASPRPAGAKPAQGSAGANAQGASRSDEQEQHFASVLRGKCAPAEPKSETKDKTTSSDNQAAAGPAAATAATATVDPALLGADALLAARLQPALRPDATTTDTTASALAVALTRDGLKPGADARAGLAQAAGVADPRRPLAAGVTDIGAGLKSMAALSAKDAASASDPGFAALLGRARQEGSAKDASLTQVADTSTSTLAMLMPTNLPTESTASAATRPTTLIEAPVGSPLFADETAQRVTWLAKNGIEHAEIRVTPPDMGPIQVSIDMHQNEATITFTVAQTDTRVALEDSLHRLEAMLADSGIALAQANVGQQSPGQGQADNQAGGRSGGGTREGRGSALEGIGGPALQGASGRAPLAMRGLVDTFA